MGYRLLGWAVWKLFLRKRLSRMARPAMVAAVVLGLIGGLAYAQSRGND